MGEHSKGKDDNTEQAKYWLQGYHTNGLLTLQQLIDAIVKPETFKEIKMPVFVGYYYKNEKEQDPVVSVDAIKKNV